MRKFLLVVAILVVAWGYWYFRTGTFSQINYARINHGMTRNEVADLLGSQGTEVPAPDKLPGDMVVQWDHSYNYGISWAIGLYVQVTFRNGVVVDKKYWEPSL